MKIGITQGLIYCASALAIAGIGIASASQPTQAANEISLAQLAGKWNGDGWGVRTKGGNKEGVRCRLTAKYQKKARKLALSGKCAATSGTYTMLGHIADRPDTERVTGRWVNPRGVGAINIAGERHGNRLIFIFEGTDEVTKEKVKYKTVWDLRADGFSLGTGFASDETTSLGQINFHK